MTNPYHGLPDHAFWKRAVASAGPDLDPVVEPGFTIGPSDRIATAGSCFAQHISRALASGGYRYLVTEPAPEGDADPASYGVFPARFGNIYTVRQLLQTFERAYGLFRPQLKAWRRADGRIVDPFRPRVAREGFEDEAAMLADRKRHLACVRSMFEDCDVFIFTLGLTESWITVAEGAVLPLAPGVCGGEPGPDYRFHNFGVQEMVDDFGRFLGRLRVVNAGVTVVLTVSPVPLIATCEPRHVLVSNTYSKAALRVAAEMIRQQDQGVHYFPSYEMVTGPQARGRYFADDLRSVTEAGVAHVMEVFGRRHLAGAADDRPRAKASPAHAPAALTIEDERRHEKLADVVCDEDAIEA